MGYKKTPSEVCSRAWAMYKEHCESEGLVPLNRFCATIGVDVQRLYEWLRRRKISISDYQSHIPVSDKECCADDPEFREVRIERDPLPVGSFTEQPGHVVRDIRIDVGSGICVSLSGMGLCEIAELVDELRRRSDVVS